MGTALALLTVTVSCNDNKGTVIRPGEVKSTRNTFLLYLGTDNSDFYDEAVEKRDILIDNWDNSFDGNMIVFADVSGRSGMDDYAHLIKIGPRTADGLIADTVKSYYNPDSSDPAFLKQVLNDTKSLYPAEVMGMGVLSHALGWLPKDLYSSPSRALIEDSGSFMELSDFADAIPYKLDYLICDLCFMGGIEVVYELKDKVDYIVSSPAEVLVPGFDYANILKRLFTSSFGEKNVTEVAYDFYYYYASMNNSWAAATVSVVKTAELDALAQFVRESDLIPWMGTESYLNSVQNYHPRYYFYSDLGHLINTMYGESSLLTAQFQNYLDKAIVAAYNTPYYYSALNGRRNDIVYYSGLTVYIPRTAYPQLNEYYKDLKWYRAVYQ